MSHKEDNCSKVFEYVLDEVGHFGYFQKRLFLLCTWLQILSVPVLLYSSLLTELPNSTSYQCDDNYTEKIVEHSWMCINSTSFRPKENLPQWMYSTNKTGQNDAISYMQSSGLAVGAILGGFITDLLGRKNVLFLSFALMMSSHALTATCSSFRCFCIWRFLSNLFTSSFMIPSVVLYMEYVGRHWRDVCFCSCIWWFGFLLFSIQVMITHNWMYLAISTGVIGLPMTGLYFIFPESFRWYCCRQKFPKAEVTLREFTSCNTHRKPDVSSVCDYINSVMTNAMRVRTYTYIDIFKTRRMVVYTSVLCAASFLSCTVYRCLMEKVWNLTSVIYIDNCLRYMVDLPIIFTALIISKCIGRRWCIFLYSLSSGFALMCVIVLTVVNGLLTDDEIITGISLFGKLGVAATIIFLLLVSLEVYPSTIRCMGVALVLTSDVAGLSMGRYLTSFLYESFQATLIYIGYGVVMSFVGVISLLLPETFNQPLPDMVYSRHRVIASQSITIPHGWSELARRK